MRAVLALVIAAAVVAAGAFFWLKRDGGAGGTVAASPGVTMSSPMGQSKDPNDPIEKMFRRGLYPEAIAAWQKEAAKGNAQAAHRLGVEYQDGKPGVVQRDYAKAVQFHTQAAMAGNALSMFDLGSLHEYGFGVERNIGEAARWYGYSARYGLAQGQYNYATMLERGDGVALDDVEAYKFFVLAARGGFTGVPYDNSGLKIDRNAPTPAEAMQRRLTAAQVAEGRARADTFEPQKGPLPI
ncbi:MAG: tetratricopeptide repeat protein [Micropepsaceae bacterium]